MEVSDNGAKVEVYARSDGAEDAADIQRFACYIAHKVQKGYAVTSFVTMMKPNDGGQSTMLKVEMEDSQQKRA